MGDLLSQWKALVAIGGLAVFFAWESIGPFFQFAGRVRHALRNLTIAAINVVAVTVVYSAGVVALTEYVSREGFGLLYLAPISEGVRIALGMLLLDAANYWWHRANHAVPFLWRLHRMHHSDTAMDVSTASRFHTIEILIGGLLRIALIPLLGLPISALLLYDLILVISTQFHHANISIGPRLDRLVRGAIVSPNMHKLHHSDAPAELNTNFASVLSIWDRLFGTYGERADYHEIRFGVEGLSDPNLQTLGGMLRTPLVDETRAGGPPA